MKFKGVFSSPDRIIALLVLVLTVIVISILAYEYGGGLVLLVKGTTSTKDAFQDYDVVKQYGSGSYMVQFKDLITSAGGKEKHYYRYDITIETKDKRSSEDIIDTRKQIIALINGVMSSFETSEMNTEAERSRVKTIIQGEVTSHYPNIKVKDIYFENFLYN